MKKKSGDGDFVAAAAGCVFTASSGEKKRDRKEAECSCTTSYD